MNDVLRNRNGRGYVRCAPGCLSRGIKMEKRIKGRMALTGQNGLCNKDLKNKPMRSLFRELLIFF